MFLQAQAWPTMIPWFNSERAWKLQEVAASWKGTPFFANSTCKGRGVSCQKLVGEIYNEVGFEIESVPDAPMSHARFAREGNSIVEKYMLNAECFVRVETPDTGDLLGFRLGKIVHHLGIYLGAGTFVHACEGAGVTFSRLSDPTWSSRHVATWRPIL